MTARGWALPTLYEIEAVHWWTRGMLAVTQTLLDADGWRGEGAVLDVGCGGGMAAATTPAQHRTGIDISWVALMHARRYAGLQLVQGSLHDLPFAPEQFALILAHDAIDQHGVDAGAVVAGCANLLQPGGRLLIRASAYAWLEGAYDVATGTGLRMTASHLREMVADAGLRVRRLTYANSSLLPLAVARRLQGRWLGTAVEADLQPPPAGLNILLQGVLRAEAAWLRQRDLPWGLSLYCLAVKQ
jgi:SAM-dependent methyltransferase